MNFDQLTTAIRPRTPAEAIDLGFRLAATHFFACWLPLSLILMCIATPSYILGNDYDPFLLYLFIWWLKPVWEPISLLVLSRRIFGERLSTGHILKNWLKQSWWQVLLNLSWRRLSFSRHFDLPVSLLEQLSGRARRQRLSALQNDTSAACLALIFLGSTLETIIVLAALSGSNFLFSFEYLQTPDVWQHRDIIGYFSYVLAISIVAPFFSATGFTLYLNQRTRLEGWDIELQFKRLSQRLQRTAKISVWLLVSLLLLPASPADAQQAAAPSSDQARQMILEAMTGSEFYQEEKQRKLIPLGTQDRTENERLRKFFEWLADLFGREDSKNTEAFTQAAEFIRIALWVVFILLLIFLIWRYLDYFNLWRPGRKTSRQNAELPPAELFGLDLRRDSLPEDIPFAALKAWHAQHYREALGLLYRGALAVSLHRFQVQFQAHHTEGDCAKLIAESQPKLSLFFAELTHYWMTIAYGHRVPPLDIEDVCEQWRTHFAGVKHAGHA